MTPAEKAIRDALQAVECAGCHPWLTDVVSMLGEAHERLADYVDATEHERLMIARMR